MIPVVVREMLQLAWHDLQAGRSRTSYTREADGVAWYVGVTEGVIVLRRADLKKYDTFGPGAKHET